MLPQTSTWVSARGHASSPGHHFALAAPIQAVYSVTDAMWNSCTRKPDLSALLSIKVPRTTSEKFHKAVTTWPPIFPLCCTHIVQGDLLTKKKIWCRIPAFIQLMHYHLREPSPCCRPYLQQRKVHLPELNILYSNSVKYMIDITCEVPARAISEVWLLSSYLDLRKSFTENYNYYGHISKTSMKTKGWTGEHRNGFTTGKCGTWKADCLEVS